MQRDADTPPTVEQRVIAAVVAAVHGPYISAQQRCRLMHPVTDLVCHNAMAMQAEVVLAATVRAVFADLHPQALDRISQAVEAALAKWPPQYQQPDGSNHWRRV